MTDKDEKLVMDIKHSGETTKEGTPFSSQQDSSLKSSSSQERALSSATAEDDIVKVSHVLAFDEHLWDKLPEI